jgi:methyl-accepting chemotaxis protein
VKLVSETGNSLERIMTQVVEINEVVGQIAAGANEQATGLAEINTAINQMDQMTQQNAAMVEQTAAATQSLFLETGLLAQFMEEFHIGRPAESCAQLQQHSFQTPKNHIEKPRNSQHLSFVAARRG